MTRLVSPPRVAPKLDDMRMHWCTLTFSLPATEAKCRCDVFQAGFYVFIGAFSFFFIWHVVSMFAFSKDYENMSSISAAGCIVFLTLRVHLHRMASQEQAHIIFSTGWCSIFVLGHIAFIIGQRASPTAVPVEEAIGTACIWVTLCLLQHLLLITPLHRAAVIAAIASANVLCAGWSQLDRWFENLLVGGALFLGELLGYGIEHMVRSSFVHRMLSERILQDELDVANEAAGRFQRGMEYISHEIRNQLFPMSQILQTRDFSDSHVEHMTHSLKTVNHVLNSVLQVAKVGAEQRLYADPGWFELSRLNRTAEIYGRTAAQMIGITFRNSFDASARPLQVFGDENLLQQALTNLLSNACKFASAKVSLHCEATSLADGMAVGAAAESEDASASAACAESSPAHGGDGHLKCCWTVEDDGNGIAASNIQKVLAPFGQVRTGRDHRPEGGTGPSGTGLGLPLVKAMIEDAHGGVFTLSSTEGVRTTACIEIELPYRVSPPCAPAAPTSAQGPPITTDEDLTSQLRRSLASEAGGGAAVDVDVLIVDDMPLNARVVAYKCRSLGLSSEMVHDGDEAVSAVYPDGGQSPRRFGLILLDMNMVRVNGDEACRMLRQRGYTGTVALLSGNRLTDEEQRAGFRGSRGFDFFCVKGDKPDFNDIVEAYASARKQLA